MTVKELKKHLGRFEDNARVQIVVDDTMCKDPTEVYPVNSADCILFTKGKEIYTALNTIEGWL